MSNRVRLFFMVPGDKYMDVYTGAAAFKKLHALWLAQYLKPGPTITEKGAIIIPPPAEPPELPKLPKWKLAGWMYSNLKYRVGTVLVATREPRSFPWAQSAANPLAHGIPNAQMKKRAVSTAPYKKVVYKKAEWAFDYNSEPSSFSDILAASTAPPPKKKKKRAPTSAVPGEITSPQATMKVGIWS
jgi:hypothetical protein